MVSVLFLFRLDEQHIPGYLLLRRFNLPLIQEITSPSMDSILYALGDRR